MVFLVIAFKFGCDQQKNSKPVFSASYPKSDQFGVIKLFLVVGDFILKCCKLSSNDSAEHNPSIVIIALPKVFFL